ncbi:wax ester/triacylglycerol synthase family O-acyltransferase [Nocardioides sp. S-58]|uniref:diacylglycerol O-acyltransferase n=1 Tax=Nocardioides renjunii TaxID=3095075 RepID=A0ABU5K9K8_9ACTN|nr:MULTISPECIES: wax ester/triacylglycerol synthase domain-containing protein [unclassified Nocardioides]MDZ5661534.1 wax ester/triacylglycerol synthase family O-acyltransferase [Nocardioides sp. S-58]WQQ22532.1 wax ester/triacylglycerol synthase family O-acyltransferase [Nocardioides sp. S-34]
MSEEDVERWTAAATWTASAELTPVQTLLWRAERHPVQSSTSTVVVDLDRAPDWERLVAAAEWGTRLVRRLRQRVVDPLVPTAPPTWADDPTFDLGYHLRRERVSSRDEVLAQATQVALRPFDRSRPLWEGVLFEGLPDGAAAYVLKIHHALADPLGTVQLLSMLQSGRREHTPRKPLGAEPATSVDADPVELAVAGLRVDVSTLPEAAVATARTLAHAATRPQVVVASALRYGASVRRLMTQAAPPSPELSPRTGKRWSFLTLDAPLDPLRAVARQGGGTLDDAAVALVLGGLRRYHERRGSAVPEIPVGVRVSLDRADDLGNRFAGAVISGPLAVEDPVDRVAAVRGEVLSLHTERALEVLDVAAPVVNRLPSFVGAAALRTAVPPDAFVLTLPGPPRRRYMAGAQVQGMYVLGPLPGAALTVSLVTCGDTACIGVNVDASAVADLEALAECLAEGVEEMVSAAPAADGQSVGPT